MKTIEYLQLTIKEKVWGVFIRGDKNNGEFKNWWYNRNLSVHCFYKNSKLHGKYKEWYYNGNLVYYCFYKNGEIIKDYLI